MVKNEPSKCAKMIRQVLSISCFLICAATFGKSAAADFSQENYDVYQGQCGSLACAYEQLLGTGIDGTSDSLSIVAKSSNNADLKFRLSECSSDAYNDCMAVLDDYSDTYDIDFGNQSSIQTLNVEYAQWTFNPAKYYKLALNYQGGQLDVYGAATDVFDYGYYRDSYNQSPSATVLDMYFIITGVTGPSAELATTTWPTDFIIGDPSSQANATSSLMLDCCSGRECLLPISFSKNQNNATLSWSLDPDYCAADFMTWDNTVTTDWYAGTPTAIIASSTISAGSHSLCMLWSNGASSSLSIVNFDAWDSSNPICAAKDAYDLAHAHDPATLACTATEWETPDPTLWNNGPGIAAFNLVKIKCLILEAAYGIAQKPADVITVVTNQVIKLFPINVFYKIQKSVNDAQTNPFPKEVSFLKFIDDEGNANLTVPAILSPTQQKETLTVFGPKLFMKDATSTLIFGEVRSMSFYFLWALFFIGLVVSALTWKFKQEKDE